MTDVFVERPAERTTDRAQVVAAVMLGIAATLTALSAYNAALLDGDALKGYTASSRTLSDANSFYAQGNQTAAQDQQLFVSYATAAEAGQEDLAAFLTGLMREELVAAIEWWEPEENTAATPFEDVEDNPYTVADFDEAVALEEQAADEFRGAAADDDKGDDFELATVFFALTLFFGGVATLFTRRAVTASLLVVGFVSLLLGGAFVAGAGA